MTLALAGADALDAYRITEIPRRPGPDETADAPGQPNDPGRTQRLAALIAAYHAGAGAKDNGAKDNDANDNEATGNGRPRWPWAGCGTGPGGPVQLLAAGPGLVASQDDRERPAHPARRRPSRAAGPRRPGRRSCPSCRAGGPSAGSATGCGRRPSAAPRQRPPPSLEECLLAVWPGAFGWLLVAEPAGGAEIGRSPSRWPGARSGPPARPSDSPNGRWRLAGSSCGTPSCARACRPGCGGSGWPRAAPTRTPRPGWPGWSAPPPTWPNCPTPWPRPTATPAACRELMQDTGPAPAGGDAACWAIPAMPAPSWSRR